MSKTLRDKLFRSSYAYRKRSFYKNLSNRKIRRSFNWRKELDDTDSKCLFRSNVLEARKIKYNLSINYNYILNLLFKFQNRHINDFLKYIQKDLYKKNFKIENILYNYHGEKKFICCAYFELSDENIITLR